MSYILKTKSETQIQTIIMQVAKIQHKMYSLISGYLLIR